VKWALGLYQTPQTLLSGVANAIGMYWTFNLLVYAMVAGLYHAWRAARLETQLVQARLDALVGQLQPHFLFNTLHTISAFVLEDPKQANRMITRLSELLRQSFNRERGPLVTLEEELELLDHYVAIQEARFGDRLRVTFRVDPRVAAAVIPTLLLQPLVENAIRHGVVTDGGVADILSSRFADDPAIEGALPQLRATHARLRKSTSPRTAVHGDFWFGNLLATGDQISGVIDWESGAISGEPLRDVVRFAITYALYLDRHSPAGGQVAGHRGLRSGVWGSGIEFALDGTGWFSELFRQFIAGSLSRLGADPARWRDAALAGIAEVAATADHGAFARLHFQLFARLAGRATQLPEKLALEIPSASAVAPAPTESTRTA